jgi:putative transcriptional regulator
VPKRESKILTGARQALAFARGELDRAVVHVPAEFDVKALRHQLGMSQAKFAASFGFGLDAVQSWEQGRRRPEGSARVLLKVIEHNPATVQLALSEQSRQFVVPPSKLPKSGPVRVRKRA